MAAIKWILITLAGLLVVGALFVIISLYWLSKNQPATAEVNIGVQDGELVPCPETPNCISTQANPQDETHYAEPLSLSGSREALLDFLEKWIQQQERADVIIRRKNYLHAVFASKTFGFKDDLEVFIPDSSKLVHIRSAARVGRSDMGVNRARYETIRDLLSERFPDSSQ